MAKSANPKSPLALARRTFQEWNEDEAPKLGAALAFYSMLSIGPLLLIAASLAGLVISHDAAGRYIIEQMRGLVGNDGARTFEAVLAHAQDRHQGILATVIGLVTLLVSAAGFFGQLQAALNTIFHVPKEKTGVGDFIKKRLLSFGMVIGICLLLLSSLVVSAALAGLSGLFEKSVSALLLQVANVVISIAVSTLLFGVTFKVLPDVRMGWRDVWIGAVLTAILFAVGKSLIGLYLGRSTFASTYGAAGSLIVLLVWVYYSAQIIFFGAAFTQVYAEASGKTFPLKAGLLKAGPLKAGMSPRPETSPEPQAAQAPTASRPGLVTLGVWLIALTGVATAVRPSPKIRP
jgi:membrane protein